MNRVLLMGRLTADPEIRATSAGVIGAVFDLAVRRDSKEKDGTYATDFFSCSCWGKNGERLASLVRKGQRIIINGTLRRRDYKDKEGRSRSAFEIIAYGFEFVDKPPDRAEPPAQAAAGGRSGWDDAVEVPF